MKYTFIKKQGIAILMLIVATGFGQLPAVLPAFAASDTYTVLAPLPCIPGNGVSCDKAAADGTLKEINFKTYIQYSFNLFISLAAIAAVFMLVLGGFEYMTSAASGKKDAGKEHIQKALKGLLLVLCSYLILQTINPKFVEIRSDLVPAIRLPTNPNGITASYYTDLQKQAERFTIADASQLRAELGVNYRQDAELNREKQAFVDEATTLEASGVLSEEDTRRLAELKANIADTDIQIRALAVDTQSKYSLVELQETLSRAHSDLLNNRNTSMENYIRNLESSFENGKIQMENYGADQTQINQLKDEKNFAVAALIMQDEVRTHIPLSKEDLLSGFTEAMRRSSNPIVPDRLKPFVGLFACARRCAESQEGRLATDLQSKVIERYTTEGSPDYISDIYLKNRLIDAANHATVSSAVNLQTNAQ